MRIRTKRDMARRALVGRVLAGFGMAWFGRVDGRKPGFDSPATRSLGWAGNGRAGCGIVRLGAARFGLAWQGMGDWQPSGFEAPTPALRGRAWQGSLGLAGSGWEWRGVARRCLAWRGTEGGRQAPRFEPSAPTPFGGARQGWLWLGVAWQGVARPVGVRLGWADGRSAGSTPAPSASGGARHGKARLGLARPGAVPATEVDHGLVPWSSPASGWAQLGSTWRGRDWRAVVRSGMSRRGKEPVTAVGRELVSRSSTAPGQYSKAIHGKARSDQARLGVAWPGMGSEPVLDWGLVPQPWTAPGRHEARSGAVRPGRALAGHGKGRGGRSSARFDSAPPTHTARRGMARLASAWLGGAWQGFRQGVWLITGVRISGAHTIGAGHGSARQGVALLRLCGAGHGRDHHFYLEFRMFQSVGDKAQWIAVYDALAALEVGKILTYEELDAILKRDFREDRSPIYRSIRQLEIEDHRTVVSVRNEGYRVIEAREHEALARHHHKKSRRQLGKAVDKAASADRSALTADERKRMDGLEMSLRQHSQMIRRLELRDEERAAQIKALRREKNADVAELSERVDRLADLLQRHGIERPSEPA